MDLRIIPPEPWADARERYRELAAQERPGDPWADYEPTPPLITGRDVVFALQTLACSVVILLAWWVLG